MKFHFQPYERDIVITGAKGKRKTTLAKAILRTVKSCNYWVYDFNWRFDKDYYALYDAFVVHNLNELNATGKFIFQPLNKSDETFEKFLVIAKTKWNLVICIDELHQYVRKQVYPHDLYEIVMSLRNHGLSGIYISTLPSAIPNFILTNALDVFSFGLYVNDHVKYLSEWLGTEAWQLLPVDKRPKRFQNLPELPSPNSYIYRDQESDHAEIDSI
jgi:hypothetical protein